MYVLFMVFAEMHRHRLLSRYDSGVLRLAVSCFSVVQDDVAARSEYECYFNVDCRRAIW